MPGCEVFVMCKEYTRTVRLFYAYERVAHRRCLFDITRSMYLAAGILREEPAMQAGEDFVL